MKKLFLLLTVVTCLSSCNLKKDGEVITNQESKDEILNALTEARDELVSIKTELAETKLELEEAKKSPRAAATGAVRSKDDVVRTYNSNTRRVSLQRKHDQNVKYLLNRYGHNKSLYLARLAEENERYRLELGGKQVKKKKKRR
ncbi:MAG: hypothetical protein LBF08_07235 [Dysgonamonadaceae bacterium]|jgi:hypothetical protein|nr:hypothetical protein [Dysgonamonadaceae bacterium]